MLTDLEARESEAKARAVRQLHHQIERGSDHATAVFERLSKIVITDKLVAPTALRFVNTTRLAVGYSTHTTTSPDYTIHKHALAQMAQRAEISQPFVTRLSEGTPWEGDLLAHNLNTLFHNGIYLDRKKELAKFLVRHVGSEVRGFLSRSFNRKLLTLPLLKAFINTCYEFQAAPIDAQISDTRSWLKCMMPLVFEPVEGEFVAFGLTFSNSDFGAGRLKIAGTVLRITSGTAAVLEDRYSKTHIGSVIQESDLEVSDETAELELATIKGAISDVVKAVLSPESIDLTLKAIQAATEQGIHWHKLKDLIATVLTKKEVESFHDMMSADVIDLPPVHSADAGDEKLPSLWWVVNALGKVANNEANPEKKANIELVAGSLLKK